MFCCEVDIKFSKQELSCFAGVHHEIIEWENWTVLTPTLAMVHKNILNHNWTKIGSCEPSSTKSRKILEQIWAYENMKYERKYEIGNTNGFVLL